MLVRKADGAEEETKWVVWLYHHWSIHVTDSVTVTSLAASIPQKVSVATDHLRQIALHQKLSHNLKSGVNFQVMLKWNGIKGYVPVHISKLTVISLT
jgi:hypothetical protein